MINIHHTGHDRITAYIPHDADEFNNDAETCVLLTIKQAAQAALDILLIVLAENPDLADDVCCAIEVELLEASGEAERRSNEM